MNSKYIFAAIVFSFMSYSCKNGEKNELAHDHSHESEASENSAEHDHSGNEIIVEPETAAKFGIKTDTVRLMDFSDAIQLTGQLLTPSSEEAVVSASTGGVLSMNSSIIVGSKVSAGQALGKISARSASGDDPNAMAKANIAAAKRELDRLKPLLDDGIVTLADYNAALSAYESAKASFSYAAVAGTVKAPVSGTVTQILANTGQYVETGTPLARISGNRILVLRVDFPETDRQDMNRISKVEIRSGASDEWISLSSLSGKRIDSNEFPVQTGYLPLFYSFKNNGTFSSGSFVEVSLAGMSSTQALVIPQSAVIEQQGEKYVYVKTGDHAYEKRRITVSGCSGANLAVSSGINDGDILVTEGATVVKMAESSGAVPEGHSHNH